MINEERAIEKLRPVVLDEFASRIATQHAREMALNDYASHWGLDGLKPDHRYSLAGGTDATQENVSADGSFAAPLTFAKRQPGIYTIVCWVKKAPGEKSFPATEVCVRVE